MTRERGKTLAVGAPAVHVIGQMVSASLRTGFSQIHLSTKTTTPGFLLLAVYFVAITWGYML